MNVRAGRRTAMIVCGAVAVTSLVYTETQADRNPQVRSHAFNGTVQLEFDRRVLRSLGWDVLVRDAVDDAAALIEEENPRAVLRSSVSTAAFTLALDSDGVASPSTADIPASGAVLFVSADRRTVVRNVVVRHTRDRGWTLSAAPDPDRGDDTPLPFRLAATDAHLDPVSGRFRLDGDLFGAGELLLAGTGAAASSLDRPDQPTIRIGRLLIDGRLTEDPTVEPATPTPFQPSPVVKRTAGAVGPDVIVGDLHEVASYGSSGGVSAFAVGTTSCNIGDAPLIWFSNTNQHPVIAQNMYRLKNGRFEQIGQSWLKHGFFALSGNRCSSSCQPTDGTYLGVNCSDPYSAYLNGQQSNLGPRYQVNAHTGFFNYPPANPSYSGILARRLQVSNVDLDPDENAGATYFVEGHYVTPDDAAAGNQNNNAAYRPVTVSPNGGGYVITLAGSTHREKPAIRAWGDNDPFVETVELQIPGEGLVILAGKVTDLGGGSWQYEYAVQNLNSHRSVKAVAVPIDPTGSIQSVGFHDVNYHSGEPFSGTNWTPSFDDGYMSWSTEDHTVNPNANALRWGTLYNFRFTTNRQPHTTNVRLDLFRPGTPASVTASIVGPITSEADCNENGVPDGIDVQDGTVDDCNGNLIPDECENYALAVVRVAEGLDRPVFVTAPPDDPRLFMVEQSGRIRILAGGVVQPAPFLDIASRVSSTGERGLLSMAFDPDYAANGYFYVNYTDLSGDTVIARYQVSTDPNVADSQSETTIRTVTQDLATHNGGQLQFGPDGYLYAGLGDGGGSSDPFNRAQDTGSLLGKMLRLDVSNPPDYIPESNPFVGGGLPLDEIWAVGLRNPWRFSFDRETGDLYVGDVGESEREELNFEPADAPGGANYGWRCMEGSTCTGLSGCTCGSPSLTQPVHEYDHTDGGCSVTGGYVYRGCAIPNLLGTYLYADYCSGRIGSFRMEDGIAVDHADLTDPLTPDEGPIQSIVSFGEDALGELYIVSHQGDVYRIVPDPDGGGECGNGVLEPGEFCDDGNLAPGDGCDEFCAVETGPPNDRCVAPQIVTEGTYPFDNTGAGTDGPLDATTCTGDPEGLGADLWYCYTPTRSGTVQASTCGSFLNTVVSAYPGCDCPTDGDAIACSNNACGEFGTNSLVEFEADACESYLIRVGGIFGNEGAGELTVINTTPTVENDCDGNGIEDADDILCGTLHDSNGNGIPDTCETDGDHVRGGRLYDNWWVEAALPEPTTDHPLWQYRPDQTSNPATGPETWRCKECHGWDYKGVDGQYGTGSHRTGFPGILGTTLDGAALFSLLKDPPTVTRGPGPQYGHDYGSVLPDTRINDLVAFVLVGAIDDDPYIAPVNGQFVGDAAAGQTNFEAGPSPACIDCHGADGAAINFGTPTEPEYVGTIARDNPWELLHKIRFGQPAAPMPSWVGTGGTTQGAADIGRYAQLSLATDCTLDEHCDDGIACTDDLCDADGRCVYVPQDGACADDGVFCNGAEYCDPALGCASRGNPCTDPAGCEEVLQDCGCSPPEVFAAGNRYLAITPQSDGAVPAALVVTAQCEGAQPFYLADPIAPHNVAFAATGPAAAGYLTPDQWGDTVYATGIEIAPELSYHVQADCGLPGQPVLTAPTAVTTPVWGDVFGPTVDGEQPPDGVANVLDVAAVIDGVKGLATAKPMYALDLYGCSPNQHVDVVDIGAAVDAAKGFFYVVSQCPGPCW